MQPASNQGESTFRINPEILRKSQKSRTTHLKQEYQPLKRGPVRAYKFETILDFQNRDKDKWKSLPDYSNNILKSLCAQPCPLTQNEINSRKLRVLSRTHIKVKNMFGTFWIHRSDKYIKMVDIHNPTDCKDLAKGRFYFYNPIIHRDTYKSSANQFREQVFQSYKSRMNKIYQEHLDKIPKKPKKTCGDYFIKWMKALGDEFLNKCESILKWVFQVPELDFSEKNTT